MDILFVTSVLGLLPAFYPVMRIVKKQELNLFDLIIIFHTLNFALVPLWKGNILHWSDIVIFKTFFYYFAFILFVLLTDFYWHYVYEDNISLINITKYLKRYDKFKISKYGNIVFSIILLLSLIFYMPRATYILHLEDSGVVMEHEEKVQTFLFGSFFRITGTILILYFSYNIKRISWKDVSLWLFLVYMLMNLFFPRRVFLSLILQIVLCVYSIHRNLINYKVIVYLSSFALFLYLIYFPFYNIMRHGSSMLYFDPSSPIESLTKFSSYAINNWNAMSKDASKVSDTRSLNLYDAVYNLIYHNPQPYNGVLTWKAIDVGIPKVLKPNKGEGSMPIMEEMTKKYVDQADSYLLLAYGDFHYWGSLYALVIFCFVFYVYILYDAFLWTIFGAKIVSLYILLFLFDLTWNVEGSLDGFLSWFFSSFLALIFIVILEKMGVLKICSIKKCALSILINSRKDSVN